MYMCFQRAYNTLAHILPQEIYSFVEIKAFSINHRAQNVSRAANLHFRFQLVHFGIIRTWAVNMNASQIADHRFIS